MIPLKDVYRISGDTNMDAVTRVIREHCKQYKARFTDYSASERALLTETAGWKRDDPRPPVPAAAAAVFAEAFQRQVGLGPTTAHRWATTTVTNIQRSIDDHSQRQMAKS